MGRSLKGKNKEKNSYPDSNSNSNVECGPQVRKKFHVQDLIKIQPITQNQKKLFKQFESEKDKSFLLCGSAGTGKTFSALFLALRTVLSKETPFEKIIIVRSIVPSRNIGFLPGDLNEKIAVYEQPYSAICDELFPYANTYDNLKKAGLIEFQPTSFLRGTTFNNAIILVDEFQNLNFAECDTIMTRVGQNSKVLFCGDIAQSDLIYSRHDESGFDKFYDIIRRMKNHFNIIEFDADDIVRSGLVKEYIMKRDF